MKNSELSGLKKVNNVRFGVLVGLAFVCVFSLFVIAGPVYAQSGEDAGPRLPTFGYDVDALFGSDNKKSDPRAQASGAARAPGLPGSVAASGGPLVPGSAGGAVGPDGIVQPTGQLLDKIREETRKQAFDAALEGVLPLRPEEIRTLLERFDRTQESVELPVYPAPRPEIAVETLSLDPGVKPKTISVSHGYVTTFTVVDSTGAPWPIEDITWAGDFEIIESGGESSHFIRITPRSEFAYGNMSMRLIGLQTPIILSLETARDFVHYRFDAIVPQLGPNAETPILSAGVTIAAGDHDMVRVLEGGVPTGAAKLAVSGADARTSAYSLNGMTYLRTPLTLLSPAWESSTSSSDGMRVYALNESPVLLLSDKGRMVRVKLSARGEF